MLKFSISRSTNTLIVIFLFVIILLSTIFLISLIWHDEITIDNVLFANEYYKTIIDIGKILFGFWLANILLQNMQTKELVTFYMPQWEEQISRLIKALILLKTVPGDSNVNLKELTEQLRDSDMKLRYLADIILGHPYKKRLGKLGIYSFEYERYFHVHIETILESLAGGEIIKLRPLSTEIDHSLNTLLEGLSSMLHSQV